MKVTLSKEELLKTLQNQLKTIKSLCDIYDKGEIHVAGDIAVKLRVLFHNIEDPKSKTKSLLNQLKLTHISFVDTCRAYDPKNITPHLGLIGFKFRKGEHTEYTPNLHAVGVPVSFSNWWDSKKIIVDTNKVVYTRKIIVRELANTDGGAHADGSLNSDYFNLTRMDASGWVSKIEGSNEVRFNNPVPPSIRQIAQETLMTFDVIDIEKASKLHK